MTGNRRTMFISRSEVTMLAAVLAMAGPCRAAEVTHAGDAGPGSLRQAIADAAPGEIITFDPSLGGVTIVLAGGELVINKNLAIDASALSGRVTLDGNGAVTGQRALRVLPGVTATLDSLVITGGSTAGSTGPGADAEGGGGIHNAGILTVRNASVVGNATGSGGPSDVDQAINSAGDGGDGGGVFNAGQMTLENVTVSGNTTGGGGDAIGTYIHRIDVLDSYIEWVVPARAGSGGAGGGIFNLGTMAVRGSVIADNDTGRSGATHYDLEVVDYHIVTGVSGAGGGLHNEGVLLVEDSVVDGNMTGIGGQASVEPGSPRGAGGGIDAAGGQVTVLRSEITGNVTGEGGSLSGGVGGVYGQGGLLTIANSIIAGNQAGDGDPNFANSGSALTLYGNNLMAGDPELAPLGFHGGRTPTMPPYPDSPARDAGVPTAGTPPTDQLGQPRIVGGGLDLGAVEYGGDGYLRWAMETIPRGGDASFDGDFDGDGASNGMDYATGPGGGPVLSRGPEGVELSFACRPGAEAELIWKVLRSPDLRRFTEILRIEGGVPTSAPGTVLAGTPGHHTVRDENPPVPGAYYRLEVGLVSP